ncbi:site-specific integrase [Sulfurovum sp. AR]|uniref:site-specific integrase n=1 Tax=Sulfurovum sp. AR TaxID=1165841 RepID=UPI00025C4800|nr:site-specific integrase [Sulfurovum sp. AR]EIF51636.1 Phage integrase [Sulfurovum sp. AR]
MFYIGGFIIKTIKESISSKEFKKLMIYTRGREDLRRNTKKNLLRTFVFLYYTGARLNELQTLKIKDVKRLLEKGELFLFTQKTNSQRKLFLSPRFKHDLLNLEFEDDGECKLIQRAGHPKSSMHTLSYITIVNKFIKDTLGPNYTSHSFRQGLLTEMAAKGINVQIMARFVGHSSFKTTLNYVKPTDEMVMSSLVR